MNLVSVDGIVVSTVKFGETSKIINILTKEYGIIGVMCRGVFSKKSKNKVVSERFSYAKFNINYKENKLSTLIDGDIIDYFYNVRSDIVLMGYITYLCELSYKVGSEGVECLFDILINAIMRIDEGINPKVIMNIVEVKYLNYLGISLYLDGCVSCGNTSVIALSHNKGGFLCSNCYDGSKFTDNEAIKLIRLYSYIDLSKIDSLKFNTELISYIDEFLYHYYKDYSGILIKSKEFLIKISD